MKTVKSELEALQRNGLLKPSSVVEAARDVNSPLHSHFEWNDGEAAEKWREEQARNLIRSITIEVDAGQPVTVRAYISIPSDRADGSGYRSFADVMSSSVLRSQLASEIESKIDQWQKRAEILGAIVSFDAVKKVADNIRA